MFQKFRKLFIQDTPTEKGVKALENAKRELLEHETLAIYHKRMAEYYQDSLAAIERRLTTF